jgi:hypothetical protein
VRGTKAPSFFFFFFCSGILPLSLRQTIIINIHRSKSKLFCLLVIVFIGSLAHWCNILASVYKRIILNLFTRIKIFVLCSETFSFECIRKENTCK